MPILKSASVSNKQIFLSFIVALVIYKGEEN